MRPSALCSWSLASHYTIIGRTVANHHFEINEAIEDAPELVNSDPYGEGWLIKISISNAEELDSLMSASGYKLFIESEG